MAKLCDFGLCHLVNKSNGKAYMKHVCGTSKYIAPEVKVNSYIGPEIDMYSFGITLYEMAVGYKPHFLLHHN